eukprot:4325931-Amphidinium_carterae.1
MFRPQASSISHTAWKRHACCQDHLILVAACNAPHSPISSVSSSLATFSALLSGSAALCVACVPLSSTMYIVDERDNSKKDKNQIFNLDFKALPDKKARRLEPSSKLSA